MLCIAPSPWEKRGDSCSRRAHGPSQPAPLPHTGTWRPARRKVVAVGDRPNEPRAGPLPRVYEVSLTRDLRLQHALAADFAHHQPHAVALNEFASP